MWVFNSFCSSTALTIFSYIRKHNHSCPIYPILLVSVNAIITGVYQHKSYSVRPHLQYDFSNIFGIHICLLHHKCFAFKQVLGTYLHASLLSAPLSSSLHCTNDSLDRLSFLFLITYPSLLQQILQLSIHSQHMSYPVRHHLPSGLEMCMSYVYIFIIIIIINAMPLGRSMTLILSTLHPLQLFSYFTNEPSI